MTSPTPPWLTRLDKTRRPFHQVLVQALEEAVGTGELQRGDQLPPQRAVADALGIDLATVTRAYGAARRRGLIEGAVGRGTFVTGAAVGEEASQTDLSMNLPPPPEGMSLANALSETIAALLRRPDPATLLGYQATEGTLRHRTAGAQWMEPCVGPLHPDRVMLTGGGQLALAATLATLCRPGDAIVVEELTYPGLLGLAAQMGLRLLPVQTDEQGPSPEDLARVCTEAAPAALYVTPTLQNPSNSTMGVERRRQVAKIAEKHDCWVIEDDPHARLLETPFAAIAQHAPERGIFISSLSKCLSPGLRVAFMACPQQIQEAVAARLRATCLMPAPLMASAVASWIMDGTAETLLGGIRREARARRAIAAEMLPRAAGALEAIHVWLELPTSAEAQRIHRAAHESGVRLVTSDVFSPSGAQRAGVRISLGGPPDRPTLMKGLARLPGIIAGARIDNGLVV